MHINIYDVINKKKHGEALSFDEINFFVSEFTQGNIPDYQASALLMAICIRGMDDREISHLTAAMANSGERLDLSRFGDRTVDKHSTGGVGDKTTLITAPIAAACGCAVAKMSGRGLGHTGGTVDKLEAIPGYKTSLSREDFFRTVEEHSISVIGQSEGLAPADKKIYALRDVTATVDSIPLIASSVMSKKLAAGAKNIVLDVKYGSGAFMKDLESATLLAEKMVAIGEHSGRNVAALITDMNEPLGYAIGNICEIKEAIKTLHGRGPDDLTEVSLSLSEAMISLTLGIDSDKARAMAENALYSGAAFSKFKEWIGSQGGRTEFLDSPELFDTPKYKKAVLSPRDGFVFRMDAEGIGHASVELGAGRKRKEDAIDFTAGITLSAKVGSFVRKGGEIAKIYSSTPIPDSAEEIFLSAIKFTDELHIDKKPLVMTAIYPRRG